MTDDNDNPDGLAEYHCVAETMTMPSPNHGEVEHVWFDMDVLTEWVYHELLEVIRADGYELLAFGVSNEEEAQDMEAVTAGGIKATFVYRGTTEE